MSWSFRYTKPENRCDILGFYKLGAISFSYFPFLYDLLYHESQELAQIFTNYPKDLRKIRGVDASARLDLDAFHLSTCKQRSPPLPLRRLQ